MGGNRRATSIHRHLASVGAAITGVIGGLFLMVLIGVSLDTSREQMIERNEALGRVLAANLTASIAFQDPATARELLEGLRTVEEVMVADLMKHAGTGVWMLVIRFEPAVMIVTPHSATRPAWVDG